MTLEVFSNLNESTIKIQVADAEWQESLHIQQVCTCLPLLSSYCGSLGTSAQHVMMVHVTSII